MLSAVQRDCKKGFFRRSSRRCWSVRPFCILWLQTIAIFIGCIPRHGEQWREFRSRVQKPVLQLSTVRRYVQPLEEVTDYFIERCEQMLDNNSELPDDFDNEIHKWSLECKFQLIYLQVFDLGFYRYWSGCFGHSFRLSWSQSRS